jgi:hypothetical protein
LCFRYDPASCKFLHTCKLYILQRLYIIYIPFPMFFTHYTAYYTVGHVNESSPLHPLQWPTINPNSYFPLLHAVALTSSYIDIDDKLFKFSSFHFRLCICTGGILPLTLHGYYSVCKHGPMFFFVCLVFMPRFQFVRCIHEHDLYIVVNLYFEYILYEFYKNSKCYTV